MTMKSGNRAILEHRQNGKDIHVFEYTRKAYVSYIGSAECLGYHTEDRPDSAGIYRTVFVFHLDIDSSGTTNSRLSSDVSDFSLNPKELRKKSVQEWRQAAICKAPKVVNSQKKREIAYYRSQALKLYVLARSGGICEGCASEAPFKTKKGPFLECHHLHRLADGGPDHPENVVAVCPNCHRRAHYSLDSKEFNAELKQIALAAENEWE